MKKKTTIIAMLIIALIFSKVICVLDINFTYAEESTQNDYTITYDGPYNN